MIGSDLHPENETSYTFGWVDTSAFLFGDPTRDEDEASETLLGVTKPAQGQRAFVDMQHGLTDRMSVRLSGQYEPGTQSASAVSGGLYYSAKKSFSALNLGLNGKGRPSLQIDHQRRLWERSSLTSRVVDFGDQENEVSGLGADRIQSALQVRLDSFATLFGKLYPLQANTSWQKRSNGDKTLAASSRISGALRSYRWTNSLRYNSNQTEAQHTQTLSGEFLTARSIRNLRVRSRLSYDLNNGLKPQTLSMSAQQAFANAQSAQMEVNRDFETGRLQTGASWSKPFRRFTLSSQANMDDQGVWSAGLRLSLSLFRDKDLSEFRFAAPGLSRMGAIRQHVFHDLNGNGLPDPGEPDLEGARFIVANALRNEETGPDGRVVFNNLPVDLDIDIEFQLSSLDDPYLRPASLGRRTLVRAGQVVELLTPIESTGDAEGILTLIKNGISSPISGVTVEFVNAEGDVIAQTRSEFDGYFYADGLPMGELIARVSPEAEQRSQTRAAPVSFTLSNEDPAAFGLTLQLQPKEKPHV